MFLSVCVALNPVEGWKASSPANFKIRDLERRYVHV